MISGGHWIARLQAFGVGGQLALLVLPVIFVLVAVLPLAILLDGRHGATAAVSAAIVCLVPSAIVLLFAARLHGPHKCLLALTVGMTTRLGLALTACVVFHARGGALAETGFAFYVVAFYMVALAADTLLLARQIDLKQSSAGQPTRHGR